MISKDHWWTHHWCMGKPSELYSKVSRDGKLVYHPEIFLGWVEQSVDILMLRHEDHFIEKMIFQPRPRWWIVQTQIHEVHRMAKLRSWGKVKFMSSTIIVLYLVWVEQYMALTQKETLPSTNCHNGSRNGHFWITCRLRTISSLIGMRVVIRPEGRFFTRILTVELQWDGSWGKIGYMGSNCPTTCQDVNSSNGFRPKQGFNSGCNKLTFLLMFDNC
jgi:hypothetical protein